MVSPMSYLRVLTFGAQMRGWTNTGGGNCEQPDNPRIAPAASLCIQICVPYFPRGMSSNSRAREQPLTLGGSDCSLITTKGRRKWLSQLKIALPESTLNKSTPDDVATEWHHLLQHDESRLKIISWNYSFKINRETGYDHIKQTCKAI